MRTYKYKLHPQDNLVKIVNMIDDLHKIHVHFLKLIKRYYRIYSKYPGKGRLNKHLTKLKQRVSPHWSDVPSQSAQDIIDRIDKGYQRFFDNQKARKNGETVKKVGVPHIKPNHKFTSIKFVQNAFEVHGTRIHIKKIEKSFTFNKNREWRGNIKNAIIKRDKVGDYYLCLQCEDNHVNKIPKTGHRAGIDFGMKTFLTLSDGIKIESPEFFKRSISAVKSANKKLSRKKFKSNGWFRARRKLSGVHKSITNRREDWFRKLALRLVRQYDFIAVETLNIDGMKRLWGRKVSDVAFYRFITFLSEACQKNGKTFAKAGQWQATTKICNACGYKNQDLTLADRVWTCPNCSVTHDRDINAAINILQAGVPV